MYKYLPQYNVLINKIMTKILKGVPESESKILPGLGNLVGTVRKQVFSSGLLLYGLRELYAEV